MPYYIKINCKGLETEMCKVEAGGASKISMN